jgi:hypothetical protein
MVRATTFRAAAAIALVLTLAVGGCAGRAGTRLEMTGNPRGPAVYEPQETIWRATPDGGVEVVGYGLVPFDNSPLKLDHDSKWPASGTVVWRLHGEPRPGGRYALTLLGPSKRLGPGDDEVLTGVADAVTVELPDERTRRIRVSDVAIRSRNKPGIPFVMSGVIVAEPASPAKFEREARSFDEELGYRGDARRP